MKKLIAFVLIATLLAASSSGVAISESFNEWLVSASTNDLIIIRDWINEEIAKRENAAPVEQTKPTETPESDVILEHDFGTVQVALIGVSVEVLREQPCLVLKYRWRHTESTAQMFDFIISDTAYQNGIQLIPYPYMNASDNITMGVLANTEVTSYSAFILRDGKASISVEVSKSLDFNGKYGKMTFTVPLE